MEIEVKPGKKLNLPGFYYLILVQDTKHPVPHSLNYLFSLIKLLAQFLHFVTVSDDGQAPSEIFTVTPRPVSNPASFSQSPLRCRLGCCE